MQKKSIIVALGCFISVACATNVFSSDIVAGIFSTSESPNTSSPLIAKYDVNGNWQRITTLPTFDSKERVRISGFSCTQTTCLTIINNDAPGKPATASILISKDKGNTWEFNNQIRNMPMHGDLVFNSLRCTHSSCFIAGSYENSGIQSFILTSSDVGLHWTFHGLEKVTTNPILNYKIGCNTQSCIAAGNQLINPNATLPMIYESGRTIWHAISDVQNTPHGLVIPQVTGVSCSDNHCNVIASDMYGNNPLPLILRNTGRNQTWSYLTTITDFPENTHSQLQAIHCDRTNCIAVGYMTPNGSNMTSLILRSTDGGNKWARVKTPSDNNILFDVDCDGNNCVAVGSNLEQPIIQLSKDTGASWKNATLPSLPSYKFINLLSVKYNSHQIIAIGSFEDVNYITHPIIITSSDDGSTWKVTTTIDGLPSDAARSELYFSN